MQKLIQALCTNQDFQAKMASFVPISYVVSEAKREVNNKGVQDEEDDILIEKEDTSENDTYEQMRELINNPVNNE